ncbi:MAG: right-handed parallel beta-helix repeat-containing protein, partial [Planctomycetes bacterium]|nr:right-handed parallel beta-helix repeat-containing protein [Planctomycetota bacterium]
SPLIESCTISENTKNGIYAGDTSKPTITTNRISDNQEYAINAYPNSAGKITGNTGTGNQENGICLRAGNISENATWKDQNMSYIVTGNIIIYKTSGTASLTIEPGVEVRFNAGTQLQSGHTNSVYKGALIAQGTETEPIVFTSNASNPAPGDWKGLYFPSANDDALTILEHCTVEYGGGNTFGNLYFANASGTIKNCTIQNSSSQGVYLGATSSPLIESCTISENTENGIYAGDTSKPTITTNRISGNQEYAINAYPNSAGKITGNTGTGNQENGICLRAGIISGNVTWEDQDMSYIVTGDIIIYRTSGTASLTIEPGVEVRFNPGTQLQSGHTNSVYKGALIAQGTETEPIVFTSNASNPEPGDWKGLYFSSANDDDLTVLEYCTIEYGGGNDYGNLYFNNASGTIKNCTIQNSSSQGVSLGVSSSPLIESCTISENTKNGIYAGDTSKPTITT